MAKKNKKKGKKQAKGSNFAESSRYRIQIRDSQPAVGTGEQEIETQDSQQAIGNAEQEVAWGDDFSDQERMEAIGREVRECERRMNTPWERRVEEIFESLNAAVHDINQEVSYEDEDRSEEVPRRSFPAVLSAQYGFWILLLIFFTALFLYWLSS